MNPIRDRQGRVERRHGKAPQLFALAHDAKQSEIDQTSFAAPAMLTSLYTAAGERSKAIAAARQSLARVERTLAHDQNDGHAMAFGASALAILGERERAKEWMERALLVEPENDLMRYNFACAPSAHLGDVDGAIALLGPVFDNISMNLMNGARTDPDLDPLRGDPRFQAMLAAAEARFAGQASPATPPA